MTMVHGTIHDTDVDLLVHLLCHICGTAGVTDKGRTSVETEQVEEKSKQKESKWSEMPSWSWIVH